MKAGKGNPPCCRPSNTSPPKPPAAARAAKDAALHRAYSASGLEPDAFAAGYGLPVAEVRRMLERVSQRQQA